MSFIRIKLQYQNYIPENGAKNLMCKAASARQCEVIYEIEPQGDVYEY